MLKKAAWLALKIEVVLFLILVLVTSVFKPVAHTESMIFVIVPMLSQFPALWLLPRLAEDTPNIVAYPFVFLMQYVTYAAIVFVILWLRAMWRANP